MPAFTAFCGDADVIALERAGCRSYQDQQGRGWLFYRMKSEDADAPALEALLCQRKMHELGMATGGTHIVSCVCDSEGAFLAMLDDAEPPQIPTFE